MAFDPLDVWDWGISLSLSLKKKKRERKKAPRPSIVNTHVIFVIEGGLGLVRVTPVFLLLPFLCCVMCCVCFTHQNTTPKKGKEKRDEKAKKNSLLFRVLRI
jgi:Na+-transporting methylmalonyl-CoA/oxaloacetate decarboxylase gamma subunit